MIVGSVFSLCFVSWMTLGDTLLPSVQAVMNDPQYKTSHWGALVLDRSTGQVLQSNDPDKLFPPASVTKLFSCAAALDAFGGDHRFQTTVYKRGRIENGVLKGDLILIAAGDPTMGGRTATDGQIAFTNVDHTYESGATLTPGDPLAGLNFLAKSVADKGIKAVEGEVYIDDRLFGPYESTGSGPSNVSSIMINDNVIDVIAEPTEVGRPAKVTTRPVSARIKVDANVTTVATETPANVRVSTPTPGSIVVRGTVAIPAAGKPPYVVRIVEIDDPPSFARGSFIEALTKFGVRVNASPLGPAPSPATLPTGFPPEDAITTLTSPPFSENLRLILKVSHNLHASELPVLLSIKQGKSIGLAPGLHAEGEALRRFGLDVDTISFGGGAGGSSADLVTPRATCQLLLAMSKRPDFAIYERALPILGVDGTLAEAVPSSSPARGKVRAKTGTYWWDNTMNNRKILTAKSLAGYLSTKSGKELVFALFVNHVHLKNPDDRLKVGQTLGKITEIWFNEL